MKENWKIARFFIFRCAGFPFELIEKIKFKNTYRTIGELLDEKRDTSNSQRLKEIFAEEFYKKRLQLQEIASTQKFQEAIFHQNQNEYQNDAYACILNFSQQKIDRNMRNYDSRRKELLAYRYLQRFCTKNETVSFFGPFYIGEFDKVKKNIILKRGLDKIKNRKVYISTGLLRELLDKIIQDDGIFKALKPIRVPSIYINNTQAMDLRNGNKLKLDRLGLKILNLAGQGHNSIRQLSLKFKQDAISQRRFLRKIRWLIKKGLLLTGLEATSKVARPAQYLISKLSNIPLKTESPWYTKLERLVQLKSKFQKEDLVGRISIIAELKNLFSSLLADSKAKDQKSEKGFFTEYCELNLKQLRLGKDIYRNLQDNLSFILDLASFNERRLNKIKSQLLSDWLKDRFKGREINIKDIIYKIVKETGKKNLPFKFGNTNLSDILIDDLPSDFLDIIDQCKEDGVVIFNRRDLERRLKPYLDSSKEPAATCCDIFISSPSTETINKGDYKIVFGESHVMRKPLSIYNWFVETSSKGADLIKEIEGIHKGISRHYTLAEFLTIPKDILDRDYDFPTLSQIEYGTYSERKKDRINLSDLKLYWNNNSVRLIESKEKKPILLLSPLPAIGQLFSISSPHISTRRLTKIKTHFPRVQINNFIFQREQWVFLKNELFFTQESYDKKGVELWIELEEWRRKEGIPRQFFLKIGGMAKPVFVDFENYFAIETFINFCKKTKERLSIIEMLPGPENLWFKDKEGRYTCEFRLILYKK